MGSVLTLLCRIYLHTVYSKLNFTTPVRCVVLEAHYQAHVLSKRGSEDAFTSLPYQVLKWLFCSSPYPFLHLSLNPPLYPEAPLDFPCQQLGYILLAFSAGYISFHRFMFVINYIILLLIIYLCKVSSRELKKNIVFAVTGSGPVQQHS